MPKRRAVIAPRLDVRVEQMLGSLLSYSEVVDVAMREFECSERTVTLAIARVRVRWREVETETMPERRAKFLGELAYAWKRALDAEDYRAIAVMARTRADVEGIRAVRKLEHSGTLGIRPVAAMSPQDRQREIDVLLAKRNAELGTGVASVTALPVALDAKAQEALLETIELPPDIRPPAKKRKASKTRSKTRVH